ncbi:unnamed protein product [Thlaspi arvense]|uniref:Uncharacterized protein n=1 Tax=Thlaspi arvense TaxID=13288 RepID=A0AAU9T3H8_THLAR|nr:unnamed protein product [Thlaspi arvense]
MRRNLQTNIRSREHLFKINVRTALFRRKNQTQRAKPPRSFTHCSLLLLLLVDE